MPQKVMIDEVLPLSVSDFLYLRPNINYDDVAPAQFQIALHQWTELWCYVLVHLEIENDNSNSLILSYPSIL